MQLDTNYPKTLKEVCTSDEDVGKVSFKVEHNNKIENLILNHSLLDYTRLEFLAKGIEGRSITQLHLKNCKIQKDEISILLKSLSTCPHLKLLDVSKNPLGDTGVTNISTWLQTNTILEYLDLKQTFFKVIGLRSLMDALLINKNLRWLSLSNNSIDDMDVGIISHGITGNKILEKLFLNECKISDKGALHILEASKVCTLKILDLHNNVIKNPSLKNEFKKKDKRTSIDTIVKSVFNEATKLLFTDMVKTNTLVELKLKECQIDSTFVKTLFQIFKDNTTLKLLDLSENPIGNIGALSVAKWLARNQSLVDLNLSSTCIELEGAIALGFCLDKNVKLEIFYFANNSIGDLGLKPIVKGLSQIPTLKEINFKNCSLGDEGAAILSNLLDENKTIRVVWLSRNKISELGAYQLCSSVKKNSNFAAISLAYNPLHPDAVHKIMHMLETLPSIRFWVGGLELFRKMDCVPESYSRHSPRIDGRTPRRLSPKTSPKLLKSFRTNSLPKLQNTSEFDLVKKT